VIPLLREPATARAGIRTVVPSAHSAALRRRAGEVGASIATCTFRSGTSRRALTYGRRCDAVATRSNTGSCFDVDMDFMSGALPLVATNKTFGQVLQFVPGTQALHEPTNGGRGAQRACERTEPASAWCRRFTACGVAAGSSVRRLGAATLRRFRQLPLTPLLDLESQL